MEECCQAQVMMTIHLVVLNYDGCKLLAECLPSLLHAARCSRHRCEVVVIDNGSVDDSVAYLRVVFRACGFRAARPRAMLLQRSAHPVAWPRCGVAEQRRQGRGRRDRSAHRTIFDRRRGQRGEVLHVGPALPAVRRPRPRGSASRRSMAPGGSSRRRPIFRDTSERGSCPD